MPNKSITLSRVDPKYTKILYSLIKAPKRKEPPGGLRYGLGVFNIFQPFKDNLENKSNFFLSPLFKNSYHIYQNGVFN